MRIEESARKHGVSDRDIRAVCENPITVVPYEYDGEERLLFIGLDTGGVMREIVAVPADTPNRIIHADRLQRSREHYLPGGGSR